MDSSNSTLVERIQPFIITRGSPMRIAQSDVQLASRAEQFRSNELITTMSHPETLGVNNGNNFANLLQTFRLPLPSLQADIPSNSPQQNLEMLSASQQQMLSRFEFSQEQTGSSILGSSSSLFGFMENRYQSSFQTDLRVDFQTMNLPTISFPSLDDLRSMFNMQRNIPAIRYDIFEVDIQHEAFNLTGMGNVTTEDGRAIEFDFSLNQEQQVTQISHASYIEEAVPMIDPLILDLDGMGIEMTEEFMFDLDSDSILDRIYKPESGSGFLAYDHNKDGEINDGTELFGATSGNGFNELRAYDLDGNDWIDENDAIYGDLSIWAMDGEGNMVMKDLQEQQVGAIFLGSVRTPISILTASGDVTGQMQASGVFLTESGEARTIHQVDMATRAA